MNRLEAKRMRSKGIEMDTKIDGEMDYFCMCGHQGPEEPKGIEEADTTSPSDTAASTTASGFRSLNSHEITALWNLSLLNPHTITVSYEFMQGGFCICLIRIVSDSDGTVSLLRGASRRSYKDRQNRVSGEMKAFVRALRYSSPITV